jgi:hypothetical protein
MRNGVEYHMHHWFVYMDFGELDGAVPAQPLHGNARPIAYDVVRD